jgi:hypothetical protein
MIMQYRTSKRESRQDSRSICFFMPSLFEYIVTSITAETRRKTLSRKELQNREKVRREPGYDALKRASRMSCHGQKEEIYPRKHTLETPSILQRSQTRKCNGKGFNTEKVRNNHQQ